jgi:serine/threonine protein kinase
MFARAVNVDEIFFAARERANLADRAAYLDEVCGRDEELRNRVERLLEAQSRAGSFLEGPAPAPTASVESEGLTECAGTTIGPYKLLGEIGEGGMGVVYMAEQTHPVRRKVALKIIKPGMDTKQVIARFEAERQALALMDHPNIARVLEAGATESGRPYFVMELVRGVPITDYCDREKLSIPDRLELFLLVCQAVQHAHQKGIIHRDLKPSNVLVTLHDGVPVTKVIDFGIAKATGHQLTNKTLFTGFAQFVGTPLYMSPEQAELSGLDMDTRSDIYSLGVLLYELLTGATPFDRETFRTAAYDEIRRIIREQEPPKPSTRISTHGTASTAVSASRKTDPRGLRRSLRGELDWIVMKTLEKDRRRRYDTANSLLAEVRRYLRHEPVEAGPPSALYRFRKFARRNRPAFVTAGLVGAALVIGTAVSIWQAIRATNESNRANLAKQDADRRATEAQDVVDFLIVDLIGAASPSRTQGKLPTVDEVLARADERIPRRFAERPLIEASIRHALAQAYDELGRYEKAEQHAARAIELRMLHLGPEHADTLAAQNVLATALCHAFKPEEAHKIVTAVLQICRRTQMPAHPVTFEAMHILAEVLMLEGEADRARSIQEELVARLKWVMGPEHSKTLRELNSLATCWTIVGDFERAREMYEEALGVELRVEPNHPITFETMRNLAWIHAYLERNPQAVDWLLRALEGEIRVLGVSHPTTRGPLQSSVVEFLVHYKGAPDQIGRARTIVEQALERSRRELGQSSRVTLYWRDALASLLLLTDRIEEATALAGALPEHLEELDATGVIHHAQLALLLREHGRFNEARTVMKQTLAEGVRARPHVLESDQADLDMARGVAQFLLERWPGLTPAIEPERRPRPSSQIDAPFRATSPVADGKVDPDEYGAGIEARFDRDDNPGRMWSGGHARRKTPEDLSVRVHAAYTTRSLFLAFVARDQYVDRGQQEHDQPFTNDGVEVFINGDRVANDLTAFGMARGNREGFQLVADAGGRKLCQADGITDADWKVGTSLTAEGYIIEFEIPLDLIDTKDGPEVVPAAGGSEFLVNFAFNDVDAPIHRQTDYAIFWAEDPSVTPYFGGEDFWTVSLRLVPKPAGP